jgi:predicted ATPase
LLHQWILRVSITPTLAEFIPFFHRGSFTSFIPVNRCGKTRLVEECFGSVDAANGCVVTTKFEEKSTQSPLTLTLSAFNDFCTEVNIKLSPKESLELHKKFMDDFGESFKTLSRVLPNVMCFDGTSDRPTSPPDDQLSHSLNYHSLCFIVQKFIRVISTASIPLLMVLDDIQWSDPISMGVVHTVLSDYERSCLMFVGCYRENEVNANKDHIVLGLKRMLTNFDVPITNIHLPGLQASDLNSMISDAMSMLPRCCNRLSGKAALLSSQRFLVIFNQPSFCH